MLVGLLTLYKGRLTGVGVWCIGVLCIDDVLCIGVMSVTHVHTVHTVTPPFPSQHRCTRIDDFATWHTQYTTIAMRCAHALTVDHVSVDLAPHVPAMLLPMAHIRVDQPYMPTAANTRAPGAPPPCATGSPSPRGSPARHTAGTTGAPSPGGSPGAARQTPRGSAVAVAAAVKAVEKRVQELLHMLTDVASQLLLRVHAQVWWVGVGVGVYMDGFATTHTTTHRCTPPPPTPLTAPTPPPPGAP